MVTKTIHAQIANIRSPLLIYGAADFAAAAADTPEQHAERVLQCLGTDPAAPLQALCDGTAPPPIPPRVPREIAAWRARVILQENGLLAAVGKALASLPDPDGSVGLAWQCAAPLARHGKTVLFIAAVIGLSDAQLDQMFIAAEAIEI